jgi:hypothetical protein
MPKAMANLPPKPRLPKEPDPKMLRTFGPRPSFENLTPPDPSASIASPSPSAYRRDNPDNPPPAEYKPPSMLAEHKGLAILFVAVCIAFAFYCWRAPRAPSALTAAPSAPAAPAASSTAASAPVRQMPARQTPAANAAPAAVRPKQPIYVETVPET